MIDKIKEIIGEYFSESDRASAILIASYFDDTLEGILKKYFVSIDSSTDEIFDGYGPLSTFNAKIDIIFRLGLISKTFKTDLHRVRKIRNHFAHNTGIISFNDEPVRSWVNDIYESVGILGSKEEIKKIPFSESRVRYIISLILMLKNLFTIREKCKTLKSATEDNEVYTMLERFEGKKIFLDGKEWTIKSG